MRVTRVARLIVGEDQVLFEKLDGASTVVGAMRVWRGCRGAASEKKNELETTPTPRRLSRGLSKGVGVGGKRGVRRQAEAPLRWPPQGALMN